MSINPPINLQPHLGRPQENYKPHDRMGGHLALAKVLTVHHKNLTVDVQIIKSRDVISSSPSNEGRFGARMVVSTAHFNSETMTSSGVMEPIQEGQLVILAFLDDSQSNPIIIGSMHNTFTPDNNVLPTMYPIDYRNSLEELRESLKYLRVFPSQMYHKVDGIGSMEISHPSKTFLKLDPDLYGEISDEHGGYDHSNLSEKDPITGETRSGVSQEETLPVKMLFSHHSGGFVDGPIDDTVTPDPDKWTKFFLDSTGLFRVTRDSNDGKLSYNELSDSGDYTVRRQLDSSSHGNGSDYIQTVLSALGAFSVERTIGDKTTSISVTESGDVRFDHNTGSFMEMISNGDVRISAKGNLIFDGATVTGQITVSSTAPQNPTEGTFWLDTSS